MLERLAFLESNIAKLKLFKKRKSLEDIQNDPFDEWALRYGLFESIQIVIDLACHMAGKYNLGVTKSYADCIGKLAEHDYIDSKLSKRLIAAVGLRNLLIHEYVAVDPKRLYGFLEHVKDFERFVEKIAKAL